MLPLLLMLVLDPLAPGAPVAPLNPDIRLSAMDGLTVTRCDGGGYQRIDRPAGPAAELRSDMTYRPDGQVRQYLLLDRRVGGCPEPISFSLPDRQGGIIRDLGLSAPPAGVQPPRSSE